MLTHLYIKSHCGRVINLDKILQKWIVCVWGLTGCDISCCCSFWGRKNGNRLQTKRFVTRKGSAGFLRMFVSGKKAPFPFHLGSCDATMRNGDQNFFEKVNIYCLTLPF